MPRKLNVSHSLNSLKGGYIVNYVEGYSNSLKGGYIGFRDEGLGILKYRGYIGE